MKKRILLIPFLILFAHYNSFSQNKLDYPVNIRYIEGSIYERALIYLPGSGFVQFMGLNL